MYIPREILYFIGYYLCPLDVKPLIQAGKILRTDFFAEMYSKIHISSYGLSFRQLNAIVVKIYPRLYRIYHPSQYYEFPDLWQEIANKLVIHRCNITINSINVSKVHLHFADKLLTRLIKTGDMDDVLISQFPIYWKRDRGHFNSLQGLIIKFNSNLAIHMIKLDPTFLDRHLVRQYLNKKELYPNIVEALHPHLPLELQNLSDIKYLKNEINISEDT